MPIWWSMGHCFWNALLKTKDVLLSLQFMFIWGELLFLQGAWVVMCGAEIPRLRHLGFWGFRMGSCHWASQWWPWSGSVARIVITFLCKCICVTTMLWQHLLCRCFHACGLSLKIMSKWWLPSPWHPHQYTWLFVIHITMCKLLIFAHVANT